MAQKHLRYTKPRRIFQPAQASKYISPFKCGPGDKFVIACRVTRQWQKPHLAHQEAKLRRAVKKCGGTVVHAHCRRACGDWPVWLGYAVEVAKQHGAKLLAESTDRFLRSSDYDPKRYPNARPHRVDFATNPIGSTLLGLLTWAGVLHVERYFASLPTAAACCSVNRCVPCPSSAVKSVDLKTISLGRMSNEKSCLHVYCVSRHGDIVGHDVHH